MNQNRCVIYSSYFCFFHLYVQFPIADIKISANSTVFTKFLDFNPPDF